MAQRDGKVIGFGSKRYKPLALSNSGGKSRGAQMATMAQRKASSASAVSKAKAASPAAKRLVTSLADSMHAEEKTLNTQRQRNHSPARTGTSGGGARTLWEHEDDDGSVAVRAPMSYVSSSSAAVEDARAALAESRRLDLQMKAALEREEREAELAVKAAADQRARQEIRESASNPSAALWDCAFGRTGAGLYSGPPPGSSATAYHLPSRSSYPSFARSFTSAYSGKTVQPSVSSYFGRDLNAHRDFSSLQPSIGGFRNVGNSCYMNAVLQALLGLPSFMHDVTSSPLTAAIPRPPLLRLLDNNSCFTMLHNLALMRTNQLSFRGIDTQDIKDSFGARNSRFRGYQQQDAHEFLCACLNFIQDDVESCLMTDSELRMRDAMRKRLEAPSSPPPARAKPAAAAAGADTKSVSDVTAKDVFEFDAEEEGRPSTPPPRGSKVATLPQSSSPKSEPESKSGADTVSPLPAVASSAAAASAAAAGASTAAVPASPSADDDEPVVIQLSQPLSQEEDDAPMTERKDGSDVPASAIQPASAAGAVSPSAGVPSPPAVAPVAVEALPPLMNAERQEEFARHLLQFSPVSLNFDCELRIKLKCQTCGGHERSVHEVFHDFSLDLPTREQLLAKLPPKPAPKPAPDNGKGPLGNLMQANSLQSDGHTVTTFNLNAQSKKENTPPSPAAAAAGARPAAAPNAHTLLMAADQSKPRLHLTDLVRSFFDLRVVEYRCVCSGKNEPLEQRPSLSKLPRVLILHLKRFQPNWARGTYEKRTAPVSFDPVIDMSDFVDDEVEPPPSAEVGAATDRATPAAAAAADASGPRVDRKRKEPSSAPVSGNGAAGGSAASPRSPLPPSKLAKVTPSTPTTPQQAALIALNKEFAEKRQKLLVQHKAACYEAKHDDCIDYVEKLSALEFEQSERKKSATSQASPAAGSSRASASAAPASGSSVASPSKLSSSKKVSSVMEIDDDDSGSSGSSSGREEVNNEDGDDEDEEMAKAIKASREAALNDEEAQLQKAMADIAEMEAKAKETAAPVPAASSSSATAASPARVKPSPSSSAPRVRHTYELVSVVLHQGETMGSGHYVTHIHEDKKQAGQGNAATNGTMTAAAAAAGRPQSNGGAAAADNGGKKAASSSSSSSRVWMKYNDSRVTQLSDEVARMDAQKEGYIFFYSYKPTPIKQAATGKKTAAAQGKRDKK